MTKKKKLTKNQIRVAVAEEVLNLLEQKKIKPLRDNTYVSVKFSSTGILPKDAKEALKSLKSCEVCGIGALLVGAVNLFDKVKLDDLFKEYPYCEGMNTFYVPKDKLVLYLSKWFTTEELNKIEEIFELRYNEYLERLNSHDLNPYYLKLNNITKKYETPASILKAICNYIIENRGRYTFST